MTSDRYLNDAKEKPGIQVESRDCNWPRCHGSPNPCFAWCKCRCHSREGRKARKAGPSAPEPQAAHTEAGEGLAETVDKIMDVFENGGYRSDQYAAVEQIIRDRTAGHQPCKHCTFEGTDAEWEARYE